MNEKPMRAGSTGRRRGGSTAAHGKSRASLRLIEGGALASHAVPEPPVVVREVQHAFNYCVYACARWIGRIQRHRLDAAVR